MVFTKRNLPTSLVQYCTATNQSFFHKLQAKVARRILVHAYGVHVSPGAIIGNGLFLPHATSIVIGAGVRIGSNCVIYQNTTIGKKYGEHSQCNNEDGYPSIEDNVMIGCGAALLGNIHIVSNCIIGANSVITKSIDISGVYVGNPGKITQRLV